MAQLNKAEEISAVWRALAASPRSDEGWMTLPVSSETSVILRAGRHFPVGEEAVLAGFKSLTIPMMEQLPEGKGFSVSEVSLGPESEGRTWIALQRMPAGSLEMFTMMGADIISTLEGISGASEHQIFTMFLSRVRAWQNFMKSGKEGVLSLESEVGLYGELLMLEALILVGIPADRVVDAWVGPCDGAQDYMLGTGAIEVKTTTSAGVFSVRISSLEQLDDSQRNPLYLAAVRIRLIDSGCSLPDRIGVLRDIIQTAAPGSIVDFELKLLQAGYYNSFSGSYLHRFEYVDTRIILVDNDFPRLVSKAIPPGIIRAKYEIEIGSTSTTDQTLEQALHLLGVQ
jgi:hypothetical protein